jgi:hypothetical protein
MGPDICGAGLLLLGLLLSHRECRIPAWFLLLTQHRRRVMEAVNRHKTPVPAAASRGPFAVVQTYPNCSSHTPQPSQFHTAGKKSRLARLCGVVRDRTAHPLPSGAHIVKAFLCFGKPVIGSGKRPLGSLARNPSASHACTGKLQSPQGS